MNEKTGNGHRESIVLAKLYDIGLALTSNLDLPVVLQLVGESARTVLGADIAACYLYDQETNTYALATDIGQKHAPTISRIPRPEGPTATIVHTGTPLISNDAQHEDTPYRQSPFTQLEGIQSVAGLPLKAGNETVGVLYINYRQSGMVTGEVLRDGGLLANQAAIAICNARRFQLLSEREAAMSTLVEIGRRISEAITKSQQTEPKPVVKIILDEIARTACVLTGANCAVLYPYDMSREEFFEIENVGSWGVQQPFQLSDRPRSATGMAAYVKREGLVIRNDIPAEDLDMLKSPFIVRENIHAFLGIAIQAESVHLGVLYINFRTAHWFSADEVRTVRLFANQASASLQIARLLEREQSARTNLETLELLNKIGHTLAHRLVGVAGTTPVEVQQIRRRLEELAIRDLSIGQSLDRIAEDTTQLTEMAASLRKLRELQGAPELIAVNSILACAVQSIARPCVETVEQYAPDLPITYVPKPQITEVLENIIRNAVEHMPNGGTLTVVTQLSGGRWIEVNIADTGPGMSPAKLSKLFELFYSEKKGGLGFGLWWSRTFMRRIRGDIFAESTPGKGSTFTVTIPVIGPPTL